MSHNKRFVFTLAAILVFSITSVNDLKGFERSEKLSGLLGEVIEGGKSYQGNSTFNVARTVLAKSNSFYDLHVSRILETFSEFFAHSQPGSKSFPYLSNMVSSEIQALDQGSYSDSNNIGENDRSVFQKLRERFDKALLKEKILVVILLYLLISIVLLFSGVLIIRQVKSKRRKNHMEIKNLYQEQLAGFLFDDEVERIEFKGIGNEVNRQILIDEIMDLHHNLHGEAAGKLKDLYFNLGLHKDSLKKVYQRRWDKRSKGCRELAQMDVKDANERISKYIHSKNPILRMEAQVAMVKLSDEDPLAFLDELSYELSYWEQINIYDTIVYHQIAIDSYERWVDVENPSVVVFAIRMIGLFKHIHSAAKVREMLFNENAEISLAAVQAMKHLEVAEYRDDLKTLYRSETLKLISILDSQRKSKQEKDIKTLDDIIPRKVRFEIILALQPIVSPEDIPFLEREILSSNNTVRLRMHALQVLNSVVPEGVEKLDELLSRSEDELVKKMIVNIKENQES